MASKKIFQPVGMVTLRVVPDNPERFLNMCAYHQIPLKHLQIEEGEKAVLHIQLSIRDYYRLRPILKKCHAAHRILEKKGFSIFLYQNRRKKLLVSGLLLGALLLFWLSGRIWNIHFEGNVHNSTQVLLSFLESRQVTHGMAKSSVDCSEIASLLREHFPDITWVSVKIRGSRLLLTIEENANPEAAVSPSEGLERPCDLVADTAGTVIKVVTRRGIQQVFPGDEVKAGDLLIGGSIELRNDDQQLLRTHLVSADGDVWIEKTISYQDTIPFAHTRKEFLPGTRQACGLWIGSLYLDTGYFFLQNPFSRLFQKSEPSAPDKKRTEPLTQYDEKICYTPVFLTENFALPLTLVQKTALPWRKRTENYTEKEALALAQLHLQTFEKNLMEKGVQIYKNDVTIVTNEMTCRSTGTLVIHQKIGQKRLLTEGTDTSAERKEQFR